jgi:hypothetical protein
MRVFIENPVAKYRETDAQVGQRRAPRASKNFRREKRNVRAW